MPQKAGSSLRHPQAMQSGGGEIEGPVDQKLILQQPRHQELSIIGTMTGDHTQRLHSYRSNKKLR